MQINYVRKQNLDSTQLTISDATTKKQYLTSGGKTSAGKGSFQYSYRDLSELLPDESNLDALERTNDTQLPAGTQLVIAIQAVKNGKSQTIKMNYTITKEDVTNSTFDEGSV